MSADLPLLSKCSTATPKIATISASSLLALSDAASSSANPYKTLSPPIDRIVGRFLRRGYGLQMSGPPGTYVEQLVLGLIKSVTSAGEEVVLVDMQNKIKADAVDQALEGDIRADRVHYCMLHKLPEIVEFLTTLPNLLAENTNISLLVLSSLSFPYQAESNYAARTSLLDSVRELIIKLCKRNQLVTVITTAMSTHFVNPDGSRGTYHDNTTGIMSPQIDLHCKSISSLILSRDDRKSGRAILIPATIETTLRVEFDFVGLEIRDKVH